MTGNELLSDEYRIGWIHAMVQGEGCVYWHEGNSSRWVTVTNTSKRLIDQYVEYCAHFGIEVKVYAVKPQRETWKRQWHAMISNIPNLLKLQEIGVGGGRKERKLNEMLACRHFHKDIDIETAIEALDSGSSYSAAARACGTTSRQNMVNQLSRRGYDVRKLWPRSPAIAGRSKITDRKFRKMRKMWHAGFRMQDIGDALGVTQSWANKLLLKQGLVRRPKALKHDGK